MKNYFKSLSLASITLLFSLCITNNLVPGEEPVDKQKLKNIELQRVAREAERNKVKRLLQEGADPNYTSGRSEYGSAPMREAWSSNDLELINLLFDWGAGFGQEGIRQAIEWQNLYDHDPLQAIFITWLINHGVQIPTIRDIFQTRFPYPHSQALYYVLERIGSEALHYFLDTDAPQPSQLEGLIPFSLLEEEKLQKPLEELAGKRKESLNSALTLLSARGFQSIIALILERYREDITEQTLQTAFAAAAITGNVSLAQLLLKYAHIRENAWTATIGEALVFAAAYGHEPFVQFILGPIDRDLQPGEGSSAGVATTSIHNIDPASMINALEIATRNSYFAVAQTLLRHIVHDKIYNKATDWSRTITRVLMFAALNGYRDNLAFFTRALKTSFDHNWKVDTAVLVEYLNGMLRNQDVSERHAIIQRALNAVGGIQELIPNIEQIAARGGYLGLLPPEMLNLVHLALLHSMATSSSKK